MRERGPARVRVPTRDRPFPSALLENCGGVRDAVIRNAAVNLAGPRSGALECQRLRTRARRGHAAREE